MDSALTQAGRVAKGGGGTRTVADALAVPPEPVQESVKLLVLVNAPLDWLPEVALLLTPQAPDEVQDVAPVEAQLSVALPPLATELGLAVSVSVGPAGPEGAGGALELGDAPPPPPQPVIARDNRKASTVILSCFIAVSNHRPCDGDANKLPYAAYRSLLIRLIMAIRLQRFSAGSNTKRTGFL